MVPAARFRCELRPRSVLPCLVIYLLSGLAEGSGQLSFDCSRVPRVDSAIPTGTFRLIRLSTMIFRDLAGACLSNTREIRRVADETVSSKKSGRAGIFSTIICASFVSVVSSSFRPS